MRSFFLLLSAFVIGAFAAQAHAAETPKPLTEAEKAQIEDVVRDFLTKKEPETVMKAVQTLQQREESESAKQAKVAIGSNFDKLYKDANTPVGGNPKGDVTIIEFFDYQCGFCKQAQESVTKLLADDKNIKFIYKEYPILGQNSTNAAKAALASVNQGKYVKFHEALMARKEHLTDNVIDQTAKDVGLNVEKLHKDMADPKIETMLSDNIALGGQVGARGTPMFFIGEEQVPGAVPYEMLKEKVATARKAAKK